MHIEKIHVKNFRLLRNVTISLEKTVTVIVGRNNSGKTSLTEVFRRLTSDSSMSFSLEDFCLISHEDFWQAFLLHQTGADEIEVRKKIPEIEININFSYDIGAANLGSLGEFIIDLDAAATSAIANIRYHLRDGAIDPLFNDCSYIETGNLEEQKNKFFKLMKERVPKLFSSSVFAVDPTDPSNQKRLELSNLRSLLMSGFINAQRGMDDVTHKESDILGRVLEKLLSSASAESATAADKDKAKEIDAVVRGIQERIDSDFNKNLSTLLPALQRFGYPGLNDPQLRTETILDVQRLLGNHTKLRYAGANGIGLPETYNGLGSRNLIFILFQLYEFFKSFQSRDSVPGVHLIFVEEPEAHLHPQMQEVFIRKISEIANAFSAEIGGKGWPVQVVVTTHSTHMANEAPFESIRYFLSSKAPPHQTRIKDLKAGFCATPNGADKEFLHKFLTLTKCDLFFADKAILIEGATERLMLPKVLEKVDETVATGSKLTSQYISVIEVGGAYVHRFFKLLDFLEVQTLVVTDLDSVKSISGAGGRVSWNSCKVSEGTRTSNTGIKEWFENNEISIAELLAATEVEKTRGMRQIAYQVPESGSVACGRSFEASFMLANPNLFEIVGNDEVKANSAWELTRDIKKTDFALKFGIYETTWTVPKYLRDGLVWLSTPPVGAAGPAVAVPVAEMPRDT